MTPYLRKYKSNPRSQHNITSIIRRSKRWARAEPLLTQIFFKLENRYKPRFYNSVLGIISARIVVWAEKVDFMEIFVLVAFFIVGAIAGTIGGLLGLSGGIITVPCLILLFHLLDFPQVSLVHTAIGTSLAAMFLNGSTSTWAHSRRGGVVWSLVFAMIPGIFLGCMLGALAAHIISGILLQIIFGLFVCMLGAYVLFQKKPTRTKGVKDNRTLYSWLGLGIGSISSLLGLGGGVFTVPLLLNHGHPEKKAIGTSAAVGLLITFFAAVGYIYFGLKVKDAPSSIGYIYLPAFALVGLGSILFAPLGVKLAHQIDGKKLRKMFASVLIIVGILMIFN